jgi:hypothetical protein
MISSPPSGDQLVGSGDEFAGVGFAGVDDQLAAIGRPARRRQVMGSPASGDQFAGVG